MKLQQENGEKYGYWYSSGFGSRTHPLTKKREFHQGLDIKTRSGVPVIAAADGRVVKIERNGYLGKIIEIDHEGDRFKTLYAHLKDYVDGLKVGQKVTRGQISAMSEIPVVARVRTYTMQFMIWETRGG